MNHKEQPKLGTALSYSPDLALRDAIKELGKMYGVGIVAQTQDGRLVASRVNRDDPATPYWEVFLNGEWVRIGTAEGPPGPAGTAGGVGPAGPAGPAGDFSGQLYDLIPEPVADTGDPGISEDVSRGDHIHGDVLERWHRVQFILFLDGDVAVGEKQKHFQVACMEPAGMTIEECHLLCDTAPSGQALIANVRKNGLPIFSGANRPQIAPGDYEGTSGTPDIVTVAKNDVFTFDIDQVGLGP